MTTAPAILMLPQSCPPWCTTVHDDVAVPHTGETREVRLTTCHHRHAEEHLAYERETADLQGYPVQPLSAAFTTYLVQHPASSVVRVWLGLDESAAGYYLTPAEARQQAGHLLALADVASGVVTRLRQT